MFFVDANPQNKFTPGQNFPCTCLLACNMYFNFDHYVANDDNVNISLSNQQKVITNDFFFLLKSIILRLNWHTVRTFVRYCLLLTKKLPQQYKTNLVYYVELIGRNSQINYFTCVSIKGYQQSHLWPLENARLYRANNIRFFENLKNIKDVPNRQN